MPKYNSDIFSVLTMDSQIIAPHNIGRVRMLGEITCSTVRSLTWSTDNSIFAHTSQNDIWIYELTEQASSPTVLQGHTDEVSDIVFRASDNFLASAGDDATIRLWDIYNHGKPR